MSQPYLFHVFQPIAGVFPRPLFNADDEPMKSKTASEMVSSFKILIFIGVSLIILL